MKAFDFKADGYTIVRTSSGNIAKLRQLNEHAWRGTADDARALIGTLLTDAQFRLAVQVANSRLVEKLSRSETLDKRDLLKSALVLYRYASRNCTRATPFGLFAATGIGNIGSAAMPAEIMPDAEFRVEVSLDRGLLAALRDTIAKGTRRGEDLLLRANPLVSVAGGHVWITERKVVNHAYKYALSRLRLGAPDLVASLVDAFGRPRVLQDGVDIVRRMYPHISAEQASDFIEQLIRHQVLFDTPRFPLLSAKSDEKILTDLERLSDRHHASKEWAVIIKYLQTALHPGMLEDGRLLKLEKTLIAELGNLGVETEAGKIFHVDKFLNRPRQAVSETDVEDVFHATKWLFRMFPVTRPKTIEEFAERFGKRYGERFVSLMEALNPEVGVGFGFAADSASWFEAVWQPSTPGRNSKGELLKWLQQQLSPPLQNGSLKQLDVSEFSASDEAGKEFFPISLAANLSVLPALTIGNRRAILLNTLSAPGPGIYIARFAAGDADIDRALAGSIAEEEQLRPNVVFAEIVHAQSPRLVNVLTRPAHRKHAITLNEASGQDVADIPLHDLFVGLVDGRPVVWSKSLDKEIFPCLTNAHNFMRSDCLGVYQFLATLRLQYEAAPNFSWPWEIYKDHEHLPRVVCRNVILSLEQWRLSGKDIAGMKALSAKSDYGGVRNFLCGKGVPQHFTLKQGDRLLEVDATSDIALCAFVDQIAHHQEATVSESILEHFHADEPRSEIILPFRVCPEESTALEAKRSQAVRQAASTSGLDGYKGPSTPYRYFKIYGPQVQIESLLVRIVKPLIDSLRHVDRFDHWHFVRYADPDLHLRLRVFGDPTLCDAVANSLSAAIHRSGEYELLTLQDARYCPEVVRYGGSAGMAIAERLFSADSFYCLRAIEAAQAAGYSEQRLSYCIGAALGYMRNSFVDLDQQLNFAVSQLKNFQAELKPPSAMIQRADTHFRKSRATLEKTFDGEFISPNSSINQAFAEWQSRVADIMRLVPSMQIVHYMLPSLVHMLCNRLLRSPSRPQEYIVWHHVTKLLRSAHAKSN
ncbi:lantibiotic dehydratase [Roseateles sp. DC23W]|uniref:Lantibiotic dehydratase n=1 Tax=Pelomonas dachongensis TaxID=3299029 RepID=A0ABW7EUX7_9BURK